MINRIKALLLAPGDAPKATGADDHQLAAAVLLVDAATQDGGIDASEDAAIRTMLAGHFGLNEEEVETLMTHALDRQAEAIELTRFTRTLKQELDEEGRIHIIEMLWEVAYADGVLHHFEDNLLRRIGGLLYVSDRDRGLAKKRVMARLGIEE